MSSKIREAAVRGSHDPELPVSLPQPPEDADERAERRRVEEGDRFEVDDDDECTRLLDEPTQVVAQGGGGERIDLAVKRDDMGVTDGLDRGHGSHCVPPHYGTVPQQYGAGMAPAPSASS